MSLDLLWVTKFLGLEVLGIYALAKSICAQAADITVRMGTVLYTRILTEYGQGTTHEEIGKKMKRYIEFQLMVSVPVIVWLVVSVSPFLIRTFIPLYQGSIPIIQTLLFGSFFISQNNNLFALWIAEKKLRPYGVSNVFGVLAVALSIAFSWFVLNFRTAEGIAMSSIVGYAIYFAYMIFTAGREIWPGKAVLQLFFKVNLVALWILGVLFFTGGPIPTPLNWRIDLVHSLFLSSKIFFGILPLLAFGAYVSGGGAYLFRKATLFLKPNLQNG